MGGRDGLGVGGRWGALTGPACCGSQAECGRGAFGAYMPKMHFILSLLCPWHCLNRNRRPAPGDASALCYCSSGCCVFPWGSDPKGLPLLLPPPACDGEAAGSQSRSCMEGSSTARAERDGSIWGGTALGKGP